MADSKERGTDQQPAPLVEPQTNGRPRPAAAPGHTGFDDIRMEQMMGLLLRFGVILASTVVLAGGVFYMQDHTGQRVEYRNFVAHPVSLRHPGELLSGMARGDATAIIEVGILLLIATPIARVAFAVVSFAIERDRLYVAIGLTVLAVLLYGMFRTG